MQTHTIHTNAAVLALAMHGAAVLGLTIDAAITSSPEELAKRLALIAARKSPRTATTSTLRARTAQPEVEEEKPRVIDGLAALASLRKELKQS